VLGLAAVAALTCAQLLPAGPTPATATLIAVGDIGSCASDGDEQVAELVAREPGTLAVLGDAAYDLGSAEDFRNCYLPRWGRFLPRTRAALGNHEYLTPGAKPARAVFALPRRGWYSYRLGAWHVVVLDSNCAAVGGCGTGSPQWRWLRADLATHEERCTLAYWHHPRFSSGATHGSDAAMAPAWALLARARAEVVLAGHDHLYERFAPVQGIRSFVVGTGGKSHYPFGTPLPGSLARIADTFGALRLRLRPGAYEWRFLPVAGAAPTDAGTGTCR